MLIADYFSFRDEIPNISEIFVQTQSRDYFLFYFQVSFKKDKYDYY